VGDVKRDRHARGESQHGVNLLAEVVVLFPEVAKLLFVRSLHLQAISSRTAQIRGKKGGGEGGREGGALLVNTRMAGKKVWQALLLGMASATQPDTTTQPRSSGPEQPCSSCTITQVVPAATTMLTE